MQHKSLIFISILAVLAGIQATSLEGFFEGTFEYKVEITGPEAGILNQNKPNNLVQMHIKGPNYIVNLKGGEYPKTVLYIRDSNFEYVVDAANKTAYRYSPYTDRVRQTKKDPIARNSGKTGAVYGLNCSIYVARTAEAQFAYYVHDTYRVDTALFDEKSRTNANFLIRGLGGRIPLKTVKKQSTLTVTTTVSNIKAQTFNPAQFKVPKDFIVKNRDYRF